MFVAFDFPSSLSPFWHCDVVGYDVVQVFCHSTNSSSSTGPEDKTLIILIKNRFIIFIDFLQFFGWLIRGLI